MELDPLKIQIRPEADEAEALDFDHPFSPVTCTRDLGETDDIDELTKLMRLQSDEDTSPDEKKEREFSSEGNSTLMYLEKIWH
jgi:hypothetical protein